jgi:hypothetical protein
MAGGAGLLLSAQVLPSFAPCRIFYRTNVTALGGGACDAYAWLSMAGLVLVVVGVAAGIIFARQHIGPGSSDRPE